MIAFDTETTGSDFRHGSMPFLVTTCDDSGRQQHWEWDVDPLTRGVSIPQEDRRAVATVLMTCAGWSGFDEEIKERHRLVGQNVKFDVAALAAAKIGPTQWLWEMTEDTLTAGHLLASAMPHDLYAMVGKWLGEDVRRRAQATEDALKVAVVECRRLVQQARLREKRTRTKGATPLFPEPLWDWAIAEEGRADIPSAKGECWKLDQWLPRSFARTFDLKADHPYWTACSDYANADSATTMMLWRVLRDEVKRRGYWSTYRFLMSVMPATCSIQDRGITGSRERTQRVKRQHLDDMAECERRCVAASGGKVSSLPKGITNELRSVLFDHFGLDHAKRTPSGGCSLDESVRKDWCLTLPEGDALTFVRNWDLHKRKGTAVGFIETYETYWLPVVRVQAVGEVRTDEDAFLLHCSLNPTGTVQMRMSSSNPNGQQIGKKEIEELGGGKTPNPRFMFGPLPGREWWSMDASNIELRIPVFEAQEPEPMEVFLHPERGPYYGSYHLLVFDVLWPEIFAQHGKDVKDLYQASNYQWSKNGTYARQYGAQWRKVNATYRHERASELLGSRFPQVDALNMKYQRQAQRLGYVETIPDREVDPRRGFPVQVRTDERGGVKPTLPFSYHVSGTAGWWMRAAMVLCHDYLRRRNRDLPEARHAHVVLQVHDELVFDFPAGTGREPWRTNLPAVRTLQRLMESCGDRMGIPTPVSVGYHANNWQHERSV